MPDACRYGLLFAVCLTAATICFLIAATPTATVHPDQMTGPVRITETLPAPYTETPQEVTAHV